jgi:hypothetical protein
MPVPLIINALLAPQIIDALLRDRSAVRPAPTQQRKT